MPRYLLEGDIQPFIDGLGGVPITCAGATANGLWDDPDDAELQGDAARVFGRLGVVYYRTATLPGVVVGGSMVVDGTAYVVCEARQHGQGLSRALVAAQ